MFGLQFNVKRFNNFYCNLQLQHLGKAINFKRHFIVAQLFILQGFLMVAFLLIFLNVAVRIFGGNIKATPLQAASRFILVLANTEFKIVEILILIAVYNRFSMINQCFQ